MFDSCIYKCRLTVELTWMSVAFDSGYLVVILWTRCRYRCSQLPEKTQVSEMICCTSSEISELRALLTRHSWTWTTVVSGMVKGDRSLRRLMRRWSDDISDCVAVQCWRLSNWHWTGWHAIIPHRHHWVLTNDSRTHYLLFGLPTHSALLQNYGAAYVAVFLVSRQSLLHWHCIFARYAVVVCCLLWVRQF